MDTAFGCAERMGAEKEGQKTRGRGTQVAITGRGFPQNLGAHELLLGMAGYPWVEADRRLEVEAEHQAK